MNKSKIIELIERYYSIIEKHDTSNEAYDFICSFELELAKTMLKEFDKNSLDKLAKILLLFVD